MVDKKKLKERQPVAWKILSNALKSGRISHAYMFYGQKNPDQSRLALLFAQSMNCEHPDEDGIACQNCETCQLIARDMYPDFFWLHPGGLQARKPLTRKELDAWWKTNAVPSEQKTSWRLRKEDILRLQDTFATSSGTDARRQVYIIEQYEQATASASNTLLKFLEEPKDGLTGILCTSAINTVLPTIVSRCQLIPMRPPARAALEAEIAEIIDDPEIVAILARAGYGPDSLEALLENEALFELRNAAKEYWPQRTSHSAIVRLECGVFSKSGFPTREAAAFFLHGLLYFLEQEQTEQADRLEERSTLVEALDALRQPLDPVLLIERVARDLRKEALRKQRRSTGILQQDAYP